jgi:putative heme transporter
VKPAGVPGDLDPDLAVPDAAEQIDDQDTVDPTERGSEMLRSRRRVLSLFAAVALMIVAIYVVFPKAVGLEGTFDRFDEATWYWIVVAFCCPFVTYYSYAVLVRSVFGKRGPDEVRKRLTMPASGLITMAALAASALFSAAGAGGVALTYWALRKAGMERRRAVCREVAFLAILYSVYLLAMVIFGVLLATQVLPGDDHLSVTIVPAAIAGGAIVLLGLTALLPGDIERRVRSLAGHRRFSKLAGRLASVPATLSQGVRTAIDHLRHPKLGPEAYAAAIGFWAGNIMTLWAAFKAFGVEVPLGVLIQGFFVGMVANLAPSPAAGVGTVDAGLIGAFVVFGLDADAVFPAVLVFRLIGFWLPIPLGVAAYLRLLPLAHRWEDERRSGPDTIQSEVKATPGEVRA